MIPMKSRRKRAAAMAIDGLLRVLAPLLLRTFASSAIPPNPRVLLIRCDHLGDAAMATAALEPLRLSLNPSRIDVLAAPWAAPLFQSLPAVEDVIVVATPWWLAARGASLRSQLEAWLSLPG